MNYFMIISDFITLHYVIFRYIVLCHIFYFIMFYAVLSNLKLCSFTLSYYFCRSLLHYLDRGQQQTPWTMLARFGYEDRLFTLEIPTEVEEEQETCEGETFELSTSAFHFLYNLAMNTPLRRYQDCVSEDSNNDSSQYARKQGRIPLGTNSSRDNNNNINNDNKKNDVDNRNGSGKRNVKGDESGNGKGIGNSDNNGNRNMISWGDLAEILSVMPTVSHPWSYPPICQVHFNFYFIVKFNFISNF